VSQEKAISLQQKRKVQKNLLSSFNDDKKAADMSNDYIDNGGFYVLFVIVVYIGNRVLGMNTFNALATRKWLREMCGTDNLFCADCLVCVQTTRQSRLAESIWCHVWSSV
jgi:hypothetical protein